MTSLMTGFILNGLSESLLSSRLFRIKAWVLQVPFLSMIFLYFFDYSNLNHSKVFYLFLYLLKICMTILTILANFPFFPHVLWTLLCPYYSLLLSCSQFQSAPFILYLFLFRPSLYKFACLFCASLSIFLYKLLLSSLYIIDQDQLFFMFIAFEWFHIFGIFGYFLTLMEMTSLMTGFILNGLSESLLSSRLFRIKAWVLQVPFLSMIFLYFFDYSNLNHSKVFYFFLYIFHSLAVSLPFWFLFGPF